MGAYDWLKLVPLFCDLGDDDLDELCQGSEEIDLAEGELLFAEGDAGDQAYVITSGEIGIVKESGGGEVLLALRLPGEVIGEMALLEDAPRSATARATGPSQVLAIPKPALDHLLATSTSALRAMFETVLTRWRGTQAQMRQNERMAQLGTLTAGVAHELNNPAAAIKRAADQLHHAMESHGDAIGALAAAGLSDTQRVRVDELLEEAHHREGAADDLDPLTRSDLETALEEWLDGQGVGDSWRLAPALVSLGLDADQLVSLGAEGEALSAVLGAATSTYEVHTLVAQIEHAGGRMSDIVKALKSYSYLDQAPIQELDVRQGIDDTLLILKSKLGDVRVVREYAENLPVIEAHGSELNQVWTNLIDNAVDALVESGHAEPVVTIRARPEGERLIVEVEDNGTGIAEDVQARIFDSFFTTKPPGKGTGLGLDISHNIVTLKHRGTLTVDSEPGRTTFRVELPIRTS